MKINLEGIRTDKVTLAIVGKSFKGVRVIKSKVRYNSNIQCFGSLEEAEAFTKVMLEGLKEKDDSLTYEAYYISREAIPPSETLQVPRGKYYCPYCRQVEPAEVDGYIGVKRCPICHMSIQDFYFQKYNSLWNKDTSMINTKIVKEVKTPSRRRKNK